MYWLFIFADCRILYINVDTWKGTKDNTENAEAFKEVQVVEGEGSTETLLM